MTLRQDLVLALCTLLVVGMVHAAGLGVPADLTVAVRAAPQAVSVTAYAQVAPVRAVVVRAQISGTVEGVRLLPGAAVGRNSLLLRITGPQANAELRSARAEVQSAAAALSLAHKKLRIDREMPSGFVTRLQLREAETSVTQAYASLQAAHSSLAFILAATEVRLPAAGTLLAVQVADGSHVMPGDVLATLQQTSGLWLLATFYGREAGRLRVGLRGVFRPESGGPPVAVRVQSVLAPLAADGGVAAGCVAVAGNAGWQNGEAGRLQIRVGELRTLAQVPNSALVMDQGHWWVLLADAHGLQRREVTLGPSTGAWTFITHGVRPGERVAAMNAYLLFHADIGRHYAPPD